MCRAYVLVSTLIAQNSAMGSRMEAQKLPVPIWSRDVSHSFILEKQRLPTLVRGAWSMSLQAPRISAAVTWQAVSMSKSLFTALVKTTNHSGPLVKIGSDWHGSWKSQSRLHTTTSWFTFSDNAWMCLSWQSQSGLFTAGSSHKFIMHRPRLAG